MKNKLRRVVLYICGLAILASFVMFVWPTRYRYDYTNVGGRRLLVRMDRLNGSTELLREGIWASTEEVKATPRRLPDSELSKLEIQYGGSTISNYGLLDVKLYNGSSWRVTDVTVRVTVRASNGDSISSRLYKDTVFIDSLSAGSMVTDLGFKLENGQSWGLDLVSATGRPPTDDP